MKEIARRANVSPSTVSRILSGTATAVPIAAATRERVMRAADEAGYRPNPLARALRGAPTMLIGVIVRDITDPFFADAIDQLSMRARSRGYSVVLGHAREEADEALALAAVLETRQCDAIVLLGDTRSQPRLVADLRAATVPVIELWQGSRAREFPLIGVDNAAGTSAVLDYLSGLGHRLIAFAGDPAMADIQERRDTYTTYMRELLGEVPAGYDQPVANTTEGAIVALDSLLALDEPPTALATTDVISTVILNQAYKRGLKVPGDLSLAGFDDSSLAEFSVPPMTTVRMPVEEMVEVALDLLQAVSGGDRTALDTPSAAVFAPELVVRDSCGPPPS